MLLLAIYGSSAPKFTKLQRLPANTANTTTENIPQEPSSSEVELFYRSLRERSEAYFQANQERLSSAITRSQWQRTIDQTIFILKHAKIGAKWLKDATIRTAATASATEFFTVFVLPPILAAIGLPTLALVTGATPTAPIASAVHLALENSLNTINHIRNFGAKEYFEAMNLRKNIIGSRMGQQLQLTIYHHTVEGLTEARWLAITKNPQQMPIDSISREEMEAFMKQTPEGKIRLAALKHHNIDMETTGKEQNLDRRAYSLLLLNQLRYSADTREQVLALINPAEEGREASDAETTRILLSNRLLKREARKLDLKLNKEFKELRKHLSSPSEIKAFAQALKHNSQLLKAIITEMESAEIRELLLRRNNVVTVASSKAFGIELAKQIARMETAFAYLKATLEDRFKTPKGFRKLLALGEAPPPGKIRQLATRTMNALRTCVDTIGQFGN